MTYRIYCAVFGCMNSSITHPEISFFRLPGNSERKLDNLCDHDQPRTQSERLATSYYDDRYCDSGAIDYPEVGSLSYSRNPAPDGHRCGVCPTYFEKICAVDALSNATYVFDNHCVMDLYNCIKGTEFIPLKYEHCIYFGNFAHVHGFKNMKYEDLDYGENFIEVKT